MLIGGSIVGFIHVMAAIILVGGSFFFNFVWGPASKNLDPPVTGQVNGLLGQRFTKIVWVSLLLLLLTGLVRAFGSGFVALDTLFTTSYGLALVAKSVLFIVGIFFSIGLTANGKRMEELAKQKPPPAEDLQTLQEKTKSYSLAAFSLSLIIVFLAVLMRFISIDL